MTSELVLVVDDELPIVQLARMYLERENFRVGQALDGVAALESAKTLNPALIILDIMLPKLDGFEVCRQLRADHNPVAIILLTARDEDIDKILGLELGADDYLTKPFNPRELVARVKAILRRTERTIPPGTLIKFSDLEINTLRREVRVEDRILDLRTQEFELLLILASQPGRVFTRTQLLQKAWGFDFYGQTRTVDVHIAHLRRKLSGSAAKIETVTGVGYKLID
jgi:two-component system, OmpR family, alkaline phosphatase synthesis response regulator PhoP